ARAATLPRLTDRDADGAGLTGDRDRSSLHRDHAVVDIGEQFFAGAQITKTIGAGGSEAGFPDRLLQLGCELLAFIVLQFAEAGGYDGGRAGAVRRGVPDNRYL